MTRHEAPELRKRLDALATERRPFGYPRLHRLLRRAGFAVNHKRVYRLYSAAGLKLRQKRGKGRASEPRQPVPQPRRSNERWSMDFVSDALADGRSFRTLTIVDDFTNVSPAIEVDTSSSGRRVIRVLERAIQSRGKPQTIVTDKGPEFSCIALDAWARVQGIHLHRIDPGKPVQGAHIQSFNGRFRDECLNQRHFLGLADARALIEDWRQDCNAIRPHASLGGKAPEEFLLCMAGGMPPAMQKPQRQLALVEEAQLAPERS